MPRNIFAVPKKVWKFWSEVARAQFNAVFSNMAIQSRFLHPEMTLQNPEHWDTVRWNAAFVAACQTDGYEVEFAI